MEGKKKERSPCVRGNLPDTEGREEEEKKGRRERRSCRTRGTRRSGDSYCFEGLVEKEQQ